jgi:hypothetical protein
MMSDYREAAIYSENRKQPTISFREQNKKFLALK